MNVYVGKLLFLGNSNVGKTSIRNRMTKGVYDPMIKPTIGGDVEILKTTVNGKGLKMMIYDTCGQEKYRSLANNYYKDTDVAVFTFAVDDKESFEQIESWLTKAKDNTPSSARFMLVGNKIDVPKRTVTFKEAAELASKLKLNYLETSALNGEGVRELHDHLATQLMETILERGRTTETKGDRLINMEGTPSKGCRC